MESTGVSNRIQVSENVVRLCQGCEDDFRFTLRGPVFCKGIGEVITYLAEDARFPTRVVPSDLNVKDGDD
jgi:hypothetical protein